MAEPSHPSLPKWKRHLLAALFGLSALIFLELVLQVLKAGPSYKESASRLDMTRTAPVFGKVRRGSVTYWYPSEKRYGWMRYYEHHIRRYFVVPKPGNIYRIIAVGGSSAAGYPFGPSVAFPLMLEVMLNHSGSSLTFESINCGQNRLSSFELKDIMPQLLEAEPDLVIVYIGHNDCTPKRGFQGGDFMDRVVNYCHFLLLHLRSYRLLFEAGLKFFPPQELVNDRFYGELRKRGKRPERKVPIWPQKERGWVKRKFEQNINAVIRACRRAGVPLILCTVQANIRDYAPEGSVHRENLSHSLLAKWEQFYRRGEEAYYNREYETAQAWFEKAAEIDDQYAMLRFLRGRTYLALGKIQQAKKELIAAVDLDDNPSRAFSWVNPALRRMAETEGVYLVDVEKALARLSRDGIPGDEWILDDVHPDLPAHRVIAELIYRKVIEEGLAPVEKTKLPEAMLALDRYINQIPPDFLFDNFFWLASSQEYIGRIRRALKLSERALEFKPEDEKTRVFMVERLRRISSQINSFE